MPNDVQSGKKSCHLCNGVHGLAHCRRICTQQSLVAVTSARSWVSDIALHAALCFCPRLFHLQISLTSPSAVAQGFFCCTWSCQSHDSMCSRWQPTAIKARHAFCSGCYQRFSSATQHAAQCVQYSSRLTCSSLAAVLGMF